MGCRLVQAATLAAFIHIVFTSEVIAQDPTDLNKDDVPGRMLTFSFNNTKHTTRFLSAKRHFPLRNFFLYNLQNKRFLSFWFISEHNWFISEEVEIS